MAAPGHRAEPLKVALVGFGRMGLNHARAIQACAGARLVAAADAHADPVKMRSLLPRDVRCFASAADLLEAAKPDVVHVVTPPATHAELARLCLNHGAHVYVEKPFTLSFDEARSVFETARRAARSVCAGHQLLYEAPARALARSMHLIGRIVHVESYFSFKTVRRARDGRALLSPIEQLFDILPHPVYTLLEALRAADPSAVTDVSSIDVGADGEVHAVVRAGAATGVLIVTLRGRPIESYLRVVGTNGSLRADFVRGALTRLAGAGTSAVSLISNPYREAMQIVTGSTRGFVSRVRARRNGYPGLTELAAAFYESIRAGSAGPLSPESILDTVRICERVGHSVRAADAKREERAEVDLAHRTRQLPTIDPMKGVVLVTGGTGMLGAAVVQDLRQSGWAVRSVSRRVPPPSVRKAGVEYVAADLGGALDRGLFAGVSTVVHCAAETGGGKEAHDRNTVLATRNVLRSAALAGVTRMVHVSSLAVLKRRKVAGRLLDERSPVDAGNLARGPYVWAKAEAEREVAETAPGLGISVRIVRPGPLVDFHAYEPPGRLGREVGPFYVAVGPRSARLSLCDVHTAAKVICATVDDIDAAPPVVNLVEPEPPTRAQLLSLWLQKRPDLTPVWLPAWVLSLLSPAAKVVQRVLRPRSTPVDLAAAFSSERYDSTVAAEVIRRMESRTSTPEPSLA